MKIPDLYTGRPDNETDKPDNTVGQTDFYHAQMDNFSCHTDRGIRTFELKSPCPDDKNPKYIPRFDQAATSQYITRNAGWSEPSVLMPSGT